MGNNIPQKEKYKYVFVVLTYRNTVDIIELLDSILEKVDDYKVIIVNSYYDDESKVSFEATAEKYNAVFINVENRGYGCGNNCGIRYALEHYEFNWLIVSNPDTVIKKFDFTDINGIGAAIIAPDIRNLKKHKQNPISKKMSPFIDKIEYKGFKYNRKSLIYFGILLKKIERTFSICKSSVNKNLKLVAAAHGSFVIFEHGVFEKIGVPYDENIFLFAEEGVLAKKAEWANIPTYYTKNVSVIHKEDGSMKFRNDINDQLIKANLYVYENYLLK